MVKDNDRKRQLTAKQSDNNSPVISGDLQENISDNTSNSGAKGVSPPYGKGEHPNFAKHRFQKGVSGNPNGRPVKDKEFREALKKYGSIEADMWDINLPSTKDSNFVEVVKSLWKKARSGDSQTIKYLVELGVMNQGEKPK